MLEFEFSCTSLHSRVQMKLSAGRWVTHGNKHVLINMEVSQQSLCNCLFFLPVTVLREQIL